MGYSRWSHKDSDMPEQLSIHTKYMLQEGREVPESCDRGSINIPSVDEVGSGEPVTYRAAYMY